MLDHGARDDPKERTRRAPYSPHPLAKSAHGTGGLGCPEGNAGDSALPCRVFFAASHEDVEALRAERDVVDVEPGELAATKGSCEAKEQDRAIAHVARPFAERAHGGRELVLEQGRGALLACSEGAADAALERANPCVLVGPRGAPVGMLEPDRNARPADGAGPSTEFGEVGEVEREHVGRGWQRSPSVPEAPLLEGAPVVGVGAAGVIGARLLEVALGGGLEVVQIGPLGRELASR